MEKEIIVNWSLIAAIIALTAVLVSVIAIWIQGRQWRIALQTDLLIKLMEKFYNPEMRQIRKIAAEELLKEQTTDFEEIYQLLDYFILIGSLINKKALSLELTYTMFEYWIVRYWYCVKDHVYNLRISHKDPELFITLEKLASKMKIYRQSRGLIPISDNEAHKFLESESKN